MTLEFSNDELKQIDDLIKVTPFQYAYPFFEFFRNKIIQAQQAEQQQTAKPAAVVEDLRIVD